MTIRETFEKGRAEFELIKHVQRGGCDGCDANLEMLDSIRKFLDTYTKDLLQSTLDGLPEEDRPKLGSENQEIYVAYANGFNSFRQVVIHELTAALAELGKEEK